jgi:hypothetical protein
LLSLRKLTALVPGPTAASSLRPRPLTEFSDQSLIMSSKPMARQRIVPAIPHQLTVRRAKVVPAGKKFTIGHPISGYIHVANHFLTFGKRSKRRSATYSKHSQLPANSSFPPVCVVFRGKQTVSSGVPRSRSPPHPLLSAKRTCVTTSKPLEHIYCLFSVHLVRHRATTPDMESRHSKP